MKNKEIWANALLSDRKILFWYTGSRCTDIFDFNKDFYFAGINFSEYAKVHKLELVNMKFEVQSCCDSNLIFNVLAPKFYEQYEISPDSKGRKPYL